MVKSIYKIINKINNKSYIGQSKNVRKRILQHKYGKQGETSIIHNAIKKYGIENFDVEILEENIADYNEKEKYWIKFYNTTDRRYGYNVASGGENPPIIYGEDSFLCKYSDEDIERVRKDIYNTSMQLKDIAKKYGMEEQYVSLINRGIARKSDKYVYPIRDLKNKIIGQEEVDNVVYLLKKTSKSVSEISKETGISDIKIYYINIGKHINSRKELNYPIRNGRYSDEFIYDIIEDLKDNKLMIDDICKKYDISRPTVSRINNGKIHVEDDVLYPIRTSKNRVYKPVETIPS